MRKLLLLTLALSCSVVFAQTYKWRDANGRIQYTDTPPPAGARDVQTLKGGPPPAPNASGSPASQRSVADQEAEFRKRLAEREEAKAKQAKAEEDEKIRIRNCDQAKGQLAAIQAGGRMVRFSASGERITLDDSDRERAVAEAQRDVESWCNQKPTPR